MKAGCLKLREIEQESNEKKNANVNFCRFRSNFDWDQVWFRYLFFGTRVQREIRRNTAKGFLIFHRLCFILFQFELCKKKKQKKNDF